MRPMTADFSIFLTAGDQQLLQSEVLFQLRTMYVGVMLMLVELCKSPLVVSGSCGDIVVGASPSVAQ